MYHIENNEAINFTFKFGKTINVLEDDFYGVIYNTIVSIKKKNPDNVYILKSYELTQQINIIF